MFLKSFSEPLNQFQLNLEQIILGQMLSNLFKQRARFPSKCYDWEKVKIGRVFKNQ